jgi:hypothetical protein
VSGAAERPADDDPSAVFQARLHAILTAVIGRLEQLSDEVLDAVRGRRPRERGEPS